MAKHQKEMEKASASAVARERAAVLKLLQELGFGSGAKTLTAAVLMKFGERNVSKLYPGTYVLGKKTHGDVYATFKGLYAQKNEINWNMATNRPNSKNPITKTVLGFKRYLADEDTRNDPIDDEDDVPSRAAQTTTTTTTSMWGGHRISYPPPSDDDQGEDTEDDE